MSSVTGEEIMGIVGRHPESGVRIEVERARALQPPWRYEGEVVTPSDRYKVAATLGEDGGVSVELQSGAPPALAEKTRLLVRSAWKHAHEEEAPPPRRIVRWRADR
ncbi:MAG TPA: hypothetical protein VGG39_02855 [Polyangiaceae bacterium]